MQNQQLLSLDNNYLKRLIPVMSSMLSFQNAWPIKREAVYTLVHFHIFIHYLNQIGSQLAYFLTQIIQC